MPLTFPAHQSVVVPLKLRWPARFDGIALVVGSAAPDLFYTFTGRTGVGSHSIAGLFVFAVPFTIVYSVLLRRCAVTGLFAALPDLGPLSLRSFAVLGRGRPRMVVTVVSAVIGGASHIAWDSFTHSSRRGSRALGLDTILVSTAPVDVTGAKVMQYLGHTVGSLVGLVLFAVIASRRLPVWYGADETAQARAIDLGASLRMLVIGGTGATVLIGLVVTRMLDESPFFLTGLLVVLALLVTGAIAQWASTAGPAVESGDERRFRIRT